MGLFLQEWGLWGEAFPEKLDLEMGTGMEKVRGQQCWLAVLKGVLQDREGSCVVLQGGGSQLQGVVVGHPGVHLSLPPKDKE